MPDSSSDKRRPRAPRENRLIDVPSPPPSTRPPSPSMTWHPAHRRQDAGGEHQPEQRQRQEHLPAEPHQLIVAEAREGRAHPEKNEHHKKNLGDQPDRPRDPGERGDRDRRQPAAEKQD